MAHNRYLLFGIRMYENPGGMNDLLGDYDTMDDTMDEIKKNIQESDYDEYQVYDRLCGELLPIEDSVLTIRKRIKSSGTEYYGKTFEHNGIIVSVLFMCRNSCNVNPSYELNGNIVTVTCTKCGDCVHVDLNGSDWSMS